MSRKGAMFLVVLGAVFMSTGAVYLRFVEDAEGFQILFYRTLTMVPVVLTIICLRRRRTPLAVFQSLDRSDLFIGVLLSGAMTGYVFAVLNTTVASALFILTASPLIAAIVALVWIGEKPRPVTWLAMACACGGVLYMAGDGYAAGRTFGNLCAFLSATAFATMLVYARRCGKSDILGGTFLASVLSGAYGLVFSLALGPGLAVSIDDLLVVLGMGLFAIGIGIGLLTWATPHLPAAEVAVLVLVESVLAPVWVWLLGFEGVTGPELAGGCLVLAAVVLLSVFAGRQPEPSQSGRSRIS